MSTFTKKYVRVNLDLTEDVAAIMDQMATRRRVSRVALIRTALGVLQAADSGADKGKTLVLTDEIEPGHIVLVAPL